MLNETAKITSDNKDDEQLSNSELLLLGTSLSTLIGMIALAIGTA